MYLNFLGEWFVDEIKFGTCAKMKIDRNKLKKSSSEVVSLLDYK